MELRAVIFIPKKIFKFQPITRLAIVIQLFFLALVRAILEIYRPNLLFVTEKQVFTLEMRIYESENWAFFLSNMSWTSGSFKMVIFFSNWNRSFLMVVVRLLIMARLDHAILAASILTFVTVVDSFLCLYVPFTDSLAFHFVW